MEDTDPDAQTTPTPDADASASGGPILPAPRSLRPLSVSAALLAWGRGLVVASMVVLAIVAAILIGVLVVLSTPGWPLAVMVALAGLPVVIAVVWVIGRALGPAGDSFVRGVTSTPLVAITPPARPSALATPISTVRLSGLGPALLALVLLVGLVLAGDLWAMRVPNSAVRVGALAVTCDGLAALAALLLALGLAISRIGRAVAFHERIVGARFYALAAPADASGQGASEIAVCAVPASM
jgi:hypothetical protein